MFLLETLIKTALVIAGLMTAAAYLVLLERWMAAWIQDRLGPNRVGIPLTRIRLFGLGQPLADGVKFFFKEEFTPSHVDKLLYFLGPAVMFTAAVAIFAVVPFGSVLPSEFGLEGMSRPIELVVAPGVDVAVLYVFAAGSIAVYGALLSGWASNNKYSMYGGLRGAAQLISYELPLGLGLVGVVLASGSLRLDVIIAQQAQSGAWNVALQPLGFLVFFVAGFAESGRLPFDLPETEQELVGGYHTEYSGVKLLLILVSEFLHMIVASFLIVILFFGGWHLWGVTGSGQEVTWPIALARVVVLLGKVLLTILFFMLARWSWPRFRFDQLMALAWKVILPLGMVNLVVLVVWVEYGAKMAAALGISNIAAMAAFGWGVFAASAAVVVWLVPGEPDNRPRRGPAWQLGPTDEEETPQ
ncbi:MAG: NADH-quinone oxidoreductase subunit H [Pirellulales bacterium]|nr:NADH-quinone oxidoreductase subunit H [Pirellulales bacterium]